MKVGCFALIEPFSSLDHQLQIIEDMGFKYADVTDSHSGGSLIDTGILDLPAIYSILKDTVEHCTLEVAGADALKASYEYLKKLGAE